MSLLYVLLLTFPALTLCALDLKPYNTTSMIFFHDIDTNLDMQLTKAEIDTYFKKFDTDNSTHVTRKEFADFIDTNYPEFFHYEGYAYQQFDFNQDGHLTMDDFEHFLESHDPDHDEIITDKEFVDYFSVLLEGLELLTEIQDFVTDVATMDPQDQDMTTASMV